MHHNFRIRSVSFLFFILATENFYFQSKNCLYGYLNNISKLKLSDETNLKLSIYNNFIFQHEESCIYNNLNFEILNI